jgi:hypothetical protein
MAVRNVFLTRRDRTIDVGGLNRLLRIPTGKPLTIRREIPKKPARTEPFTDIPN